MIAVSDKYQIGADIEYIDKSINHNELKDIIMHPDEIIYYDNQKEDSNKTGFFFEVFNTKESIIKSIGMGLYFDVKNINTLTDHKTKLFPNIFNILSANFKTSLYINR